MIQEARNVTKVATVDGALGQSRPMIIPLVLDREDYQKKTESIILTLLHRYSLLMSLR